MGRNDEGPLTKVGMGPFPLPGERKRMRDAEQRRVAEVTEKYGRSHVDPKQSPPGRAKADAAVDLSWEPAATVVELYDQVPEGPTSHEARRRIREEVLTRWFEEVRREMSPRVAAERREVSGLTTAEQEQAAIVDEIRQSMDRHVAETFARLAAERATSDESNRPRRD